jgi:hypothetical protein
MPAIKTTSPRRARGVLFLGGALALAVPVFSGAACAPADSYNGGGEERTASPDQEALNSIPQYAHKALCAAAQPGSRRCHAHVRTRPDGTVQPSATPQGLTPAELQAAYKIPTGGTGTVAIIDAQDDPNAESDLAVYRAQFGLPACTTANGCFKKVNQTGAASPLPKGDTGWGGEISLDLDMVSAACPTCKILLVEATSASNSDLGTAVNTAASLGANAISNSYGGSEDSSNSTYDSQYYNHPGILITASSGDSGYGAEYPASGFYVLGVGGTSLTQSTSTRGWAEAAWSDGGAGCSAYTAKPSFQKDTGCTKRTVADMAAVADPNTGVAVYDTYGGSKAGASGWEVYGGTSASSPLVAAIMVASGKAGQANSWVYANTGDFYDVTTGSDGSCSSSAKYLCTAGAGYDGPTGWGTPNAAAILAGSGSSSSSSSSTSTSTSSTSSSTSSSSGKTSTSSSSSSTTSSTSSSSTSTSSSTSSTSSSGGGGGTCSHNECTTGVHLTSGCDPCVTKICAQDSFCCHHQWDSVCVGEAGSICGETCGGGGNVGTCTHALCSTGPMQQSGCDSCATDICSHDPYCCQVTWDSVCTSEVGSICGLSCPGN